jgi:hypothetical protein
LYGNSGRIKRPPVSRAEQIGRRSCICVSVVRRAVPAQSRRDFNLRGISTLDSDIGVEGFQPPGGESWWEIPSETPPICEFGSRSCVCVYFCSTYYKAARVGGEPVSSLSSVLQNWTASPFQREFFGSPRVSKKNMFTKFSNKGGQEHSKIVDILEGVGGVCVCVWGSG